MVRAFFLFFSLCLAASVQAATISALPGNDPSEGTILVEGELTSQDIDTFRTKASLFSKAIVVLRSDGGAVVAGVEIGKIIRFRNFATWVPSGVICASACGIAWLGGSPRVMGKKALVGFHAAYRFEGGRPTESGAANAVVGAYFAKLGLPDRAIIYLTSQRPSSMTWLTAPDAKALGIDVRLFDLADSNNAGSQETGNSASLERRAAAFVDNVYTRLGSSNAEMISWAFQHYSSTTDYFGKSRSRDDILKDLTRWFERWPKRLYVPQRKSTMIKCDHTNSICEVEGLLDFIAESPDRNERSVGLATFSFRLNFADNSSEPKILSENGRTLQRHKEELVPSGGIASGSEPAEPLSLYPRARSNF